MALLFAKNKIKFPQKHVWILWVCLIFSASMLAAMGLVKSYEYVVNKIQEKEKMESLTNAEIEILNRFISKRKLTHCFSRASSTLKVLEHDEVVYLVSKDTKTHYRCYSIHRWAYFYLLDHPELLKENPT